MIQPQILIVLSFISASFSCICVHCVGAVCVIEKQEQGEYKYIELHIPAYNSVQSNVTHVRII